MGNQIRLHEGCLFGGGGGKSNLFLYLLQYFLCAASYLKTF